ncbi:MAG TPA: SGNH/GDSL hydrolase family protein [Elusimicrobiota bacterium]|nr:SGNH/GDSL hydrolase family protein [Elusimicrobiota bacterium]
MKRRMPSRPVTAVLTVGALVSAFLASEVLFRVFVPQYAPSPPPAGTIQFLIDAWGPFAKTERRDGTRRLVKASKDGWLFPEGMPLSPRPGVLRVAVIGESSAGLLAGSLRYLLEGGPSADRVEIIDAAIGGASLEQTERRFGEITGYRPDVVVLLFGQNLGIQHPFMSRWRAAVGGMARRSRLLSYAAESFRRAEETEDRPARLAAFEAALKRMVLTCRERGIRLVLCTSPLNALYPPAKPHAQEFDPRFFEAIYDHSSGRKDRALSELRALSVSKPMAYAFFLRGWWNLAAGNSAAAVVDMERAADLDLDPKRVWSDTNPLIRRISRESGAALLDFDRLLKNASGKALLGWDEFFDYAHLHEGYRHQEAAWFLRSLEDSGLLKDVRMKPISSPPVRSWGEMKYPVVEMLYFDNPRFFDAFRCQVSWRLATEGDGFLPRLRRLVSMEEVLSAPAHRRARLTVAIAEGCFERGRWSEGIDYLRMARNDHPSGEDPDVAEAFMHWRRGDTKEALRCFRTAREKNPRPDVVYFAERLSEEPGPRGARR